MAARVLFQRRAAPLTAAVLVGSVAFYPRIAHAEASSSDRQFPRKPIYDDDLDILPTPSKPSTSTPAPATAIPLPSSVVEPEVPSSPSPARRQTPTDQLASQIRLARLFLYSHACATEDAINSLMSRAFALEESFTSTIASLAPPRESNEKLTPGLIYVLVAGMAGSIISRNRNVILRGATPLALGLGAAWTVLPITMGNVSELVWKYEQKVPAVADAHLKTREGIEKGIYFAKVHADLAQRKVHEGVTEVREAVEGWIKKGK
ncbi:micos subunit MIC26 [Podospora fimiseda]|uniref:MICOS complex subunit n=1 Tax=Podospora fimiseda TaxID=252190 RepID=A0AAN7GX56_9PEZI|nr:micos subunit MIC26 [Podospora fimiseda]